MALSYGTTDGKLTRAVNAMVRASSKSVRIRGHAAERMEERDIDLADVIECLSYGTAYSPFVENGELRAHVVHRGIAVRVVVGDIAHASKDWLKLERCAVVTVMEAK